MQAVTGIISTVTGNGAEGFSGDGGPATAAELNFPMGVAVSAAGDVVIADSYNNRVRELQAGTGHMAPVAGTGTEGFGGDGGVAPGAELDRPMAVSFDASGDLFVADTLERSGTAGRRVHQGHHHGRRRRDRG